MSASRKQRGDSRLKTLNADLQRAIAEKCEKGKYEEVRRWLEKEWDITTSVGALSEFYSWYCLRQRVERADTHITQIEELITEGGFNIDPGKLRDTMNGLFLSAASAQGDFGTFEAAFKLILKAQKQQLDEKRAGLEDRKVALLEAKAAKADAAEALLKDAQLTTAQKTARMKEVFGIA